MHYELLKEGKYSERTGSITTDVAITMLTGGATRMARVGKNARPPLTRGETIRLAAGAGTSGLSDLGIALNRWAQAVRRSHETQTALNPKLGYDIEHPLTRADLDAELKAATAR